MDGGRFKIPCPEIGPEGGRTGDHRLNRRHSRSGCHALGSDELHGEGAHDEGAEKPCGNNASATDARIKLAQCVCYRRPLRNIQTNSAI